MTAAPSPNLELAATVAESPGSIFLTGVNDARLTASPHFAPGVNLNAASVSRNPEPPAGAGGHANENGVNQAQVVVAAEHAAEIAPFLLEMGVNLQAVRLGRKHVFDDFLRGRLVSLLAMGLSIRQSAAALGLSHNAVWKELKRNPELEEQLNAARTQAQIEPLLVILRESKRSWRAASWLLKHLQQQMARRDETPEEMQARVRAQISEGNERTRQELEENSRRWSEHNERERRERKERELQETLARNLEQFPPRRKKPKPSEPKAAT